MILLVARCINLIKIVFSYLVSRITKRPFHWGNPIAVSIEPNNSCNLRCPECPAGLNELTRPRGFMQPELFQSAINQLLPHLAYLTLYFQGEPYMSKHLFDFITIARSKKIFVATSTNGHFLDETSVRKTIESGLNRLIISLDGANQQSYGAYRQGGDFAKVVAAIRLLVSEKRRLNSKTPEVVLQCILLKSNEHQLDEIKILAKELGVDKLEFKTAQFYDYKNGNPLMPENPKFSRYHKMVESKPQTANCKLQTPNSKLQTPNCKLQTPNSKLQTANYKLQTANSKLQKVNNPASDPIQAFAPLSVHRFARKGRMPDSCFRMWGSCVITWDGKVVPCCFDKDADNIIGDLNKQTFNEIWRGKPVYDFRQKILKNRKSIPICTNCSQTF